MLHGAELLARVKELGDVTKAELVRGCGYASTARDGRERLNMTAFYEALLAAKGVSLIGEAGRTTRKLSYTTKVQANGQVVLGKAYTSQLGVNVGDVVAIRPGRRQLRLVPLDATANEVEADSIATTDSSTDTGPVSDSNTATTPVVAAPAMVPVVAAVPDAGVGPAVAVDVVLSSPVGAPVPIASLPGDSGPEAA